MLNFTQSCFGAASAADMFVLKKTYERSPQIRRDYTDLVRTVDGITKEPLKITAVQADQYAKRISSDSDKVECTFPECANSLGRSGQGLTRSGHKQHVDRHMNIEYQCISCRICFKSNANCYDHISECVFAGVPPVKETSSKSKARIKKRLHQSPAGKAKINSPLIKKIRGERKKNKSIRECLMCSLATGARLVFPFFEHLEYHRETELHKDVVADFMTGKGKYRELQAAHAQLNSELPKDPHWKEKLRRKIQLSLQAA